MKTAWDYTELAASYAHRPAYPQTLITTFLRRTGMAAGMKACDVGAGTGNLTLPLLEWGLQVVAVEPNQAMRERGMARTALRDQVRWVEATGEATGQPASEFHLVTFGSSFNVVDRPRALRESARILKPTGWLACIWNYRDLQDPLQERIEQCIRRSIPEYDYGVRRQDQGPVIRASGVFARIRRIDCRFAHRISAAAFLEAWKSHATLRRQAGERFEEILDEIDRLLRATGRREIETPYIASVWIAQRANA